MTPFTIITSLILFGHTALCFWLPYKGGHKTIGLIISIIVGLLIIATLIGNLSFLVIFIWPVILAFQIVFLTYWVFKLNGRKKTGIISAIILIIVFLFIAMQPWINDWMFNKNDAQKMLSWHGIELKGEFEILKNESGGFLDYAHSFTLKISEDDYNRIAYKIRSSKNFRGLITDLAKQLPMTNYNSTDTISYETVNYIEIEYFTKQKMGDGTYHFIFQLSKKDREFNYIGINE